MDKSNKENIYLDFPIIKETKSNGEIKTYSNSDALFQSIKIWLSSQKGEKIRSNTGGVIYPYIGKLLDENNAIKMKNAIREGLKNDFYPPLTIVELEVIPNKETNSWFIKIAGYNKDLSVGVNNYAVITNSI